LQYFTKQNKILKKKLKETEAVSYFYIYKIAKASRTVCVISIYLFSGAFYSTRKFKKRAVPLFNDKLLPLKVSLPWLG
jgi:hypothetical protein